MQQEKKKINLVLTKLFPSPIMVSWGYRKVASNYREREREVTQLCLTLSDPMDFSPPGSSIHGIFQARVLEWGAIAFSSVIMMKPFFNIVIISK